MTVRGLFLPFPLGKGPGDRSVMRPAVRAAREAHAPAPDRRAGVWVYGLTDEEIRIVLRPTPCRKGRTLRGQFLPFPRGLILTHKTIRGA
jgi:hypothetical protein